MILSVNVEGKGNVGGKLRRYVIEFTAPSRATSENEVASHLVCDVRVGVRRS